jgi:hypothetical protein
LIRFFSFKNKKILKSLFFLLIKMPNQRSLIGKLRIRKLL